jgi:DNA-binding transcriptional MerR regulator
VRISQLADSAGVPTSTVRYYERVGLMTVPARTASGYSDYADDAAARLRFITRACRMGLSCEQVTALIPVWAGTNCGAAQERVGRLVEEKQAEIAAEPPLAACRSDLTCCVPEPRQSPVAVELVPRR